MRSRNYAILSVLVVICLLLTPVDTAFAQGPSPEPGEKPGGSQGPYRQHEKAARAAARDEVSGLAVGMSGRGEGAATPGEVEAEADISALAAGDNFGYTRRLAKLDWKDITASGTALDLAGAEMVSVDLPFPFKFYENSYSTVKVARYGYLSFSSHPAVVWQSPLLSADEPNNVIAPYWTPVLLAGGAVYMEVEGTAPDRTVVFEWSQVSDEWTGGDNRFTFEVILHENGDIRFQYGEMKYTWGYNFPAAGIEDATGTTGQISLAYKRKQRSNQAVLFTRPTTGVSLKVFPADYGAFAAIGGTATYRLRVTNTGLNGDDTFDLRMVSKWPAVAFTADGVTPLADTDGDGRLDTGPVGPGAGVEVVIQVTAPASAKIGDSLTSSVTFTSSLKTNRKKGAYLTTTIPAAFTQTYATDNLSQPVDVMGGNVSSSDGLQGFTVAAQGGGYGPAAARMASGNGFTAWSQYTCPDDQCERVFYSILDPSGGPVVGVTGLPVPPAGTWDFAVSAAPAPDGNVGLVFLREIQQGNGHLYNLYFVLLNSAGNVISGPVNVTNNPNVYNDSIYPPGGEIYYHPVIAATGQSHYIVSWTRELYTGDGVNYANIYLSELDQTGAVTRPPLAVTHDPGDKMGFYGSSLSVLSGDRLLVAYNGWKARGRNWSEYAFYTVFDNNGSVVRAETGLSLGKVDSYGMDSVQLSNGQILLVWGVYKSGREMLYYAVLKDAPYQKVRGPTALSVRAALTGSWYASVTADAEGRGIVTWADDYQTFGRHLYYALAGKNGAILTKPAIFMTAPENTYLYLNEYGSGNMPYTP